LITAGQRVSPRLELMRFDLGARENETLMALGPDGRFEKLVSDPGSDPVSSVTELLDTRANINIPNPGICHPHPFFSPDGTMAFFNSNESGSVQAYMVRNLPRL
jgi:hypothetical protein